MKKTFAFLMAAVFIVSLSSFAFARGGGGGGRGGGGGFRGGNFGGGDRGNFDRGGDFNRGGDVNRGGDFGGERADGIGNRAGERNPDAQKVQSFLGNNAGRGGFDNRATQLRDQYGNGDRPFTNGWYANHPNAWGFGRPYANAWAAASWGSALGWIGLDDDTDPIVYNSYDDGSGDSDDASELASEGDGESTTNDEWLPLGVYAVFEPGQAKAKHMLQLAINRDGVLRGSYYDVLSDNGQQIQGAVDKDTQRAAFSTDGSKPTVFGTGLYELTQGSTPLSVSIDGGKTTQWTMVRQQDTGTASTGGAGK